MTQQVWKRFLYLSLSLSLLFPAAGDLRAAALANATAQVTSVTGGTRATYSSSEKLTLSIRVQNLQTSNTPIQFSFAIRDPQGVRRLNQTGNSAPGTVLGFTGSSIRGIAVSRFYTVPGVYTLTVTATSGADTVEASSRFTVLSPNITLTYPPNGAQNIIDQPLTFRWVSSGASRYRVSVDDDSSFYNTLFKKITSATFLAYPSNPKDVRQRLASGQVYYWKVEGLDTANNVVAKTDVPFRFSVKADAAQSTSKDLAIVSVQVRKRPIPNAPEALPVEVFVKNQGGRSEINVPVKLFSEGALVPTSPRRLGRIEPGNVQRVVFPVRPPEEGKFVLLNAVLDIFDDNLANNTLSERVKGEPRPTRRRVRPQQAWTILQNFVRDPKILAELEGYRPAALEGIGMTRAEVAELLLAIKEGRARVTGVNLK